MFFSIAYQLQTMGYFDIWQKNKFGDVLPEHENILPASEQTYPDTFSLWMEREAEKELLEKEY